VYSNLAAKGKYFDLSTGAVLGNLISAPDSASITNIGDGWYKCQITVTAAGNERLTIYLSPDGTSFSFDGDSTSGIYVWGASIHRSDLGGMVDNPDQSAGFETYVPTTSAARYLPRRGHHVWNGTAWVTEGLLHESEARTNLYTNSDGSQLFLLGTASETNANGSNIAQQTPSLSAGVYTMSVFAKAGPTDAGLLCLRPGDNVGFTDAVQAWFNLETGTVALANS
jgi:hypothetical protein